MTRARPDNNRGASESGMSDSEIEDNDKSASVCLLCRQRKQKCDRTLPRCSHCVKAKADCQYAPKPRKRGLRAGYVAELEERLERVEGELQNIKGVPTPTSAPFNFATPPQSAQITELATPAQSAHVTDLMPSVLAPPFSLPGLAGLKTSPGTKHVHGHRIYNAVGTSLHEQLQHLTMPTLSNLCEVWFKEYQPWCPILSRATMADSLAECTPQSDHIPDLALKALIALTVSHSSQAIYLGYGGRRKLYLHLRSQVLMSAMTEVSEQALQALLIMFILDYGYDDLPSSGHILSMCKRMCEQLGIAQQGPAFPPRTPGFDEQPDDGASRETIAACWMSFTMDCATTLGASWRSQNTVHLRPIFEDFLSQEHNVSESFRTAFDLPFRGLGPVQQILYYRRNAGTLSNPEVPLYSEEEAYNNLMLYADKSNTPSYTLQEDGSIAFDTNAVLTAMMSNAAIVALIGSNDNHFEDELAVSHCFEACDRMIHIMGTVGDSDIELSSPLLASHVFVAARYYLVYYRCHQSEHGVPKFHVLMHAMNMSARRWPFARRLEIALRAAVAEHDDNAHPSLPIGFWDLNCSAMDIDGVLRKWARECAETVNIGLLNGNYA